MSIPNAMQNTELLKTYIDKYRAWGADDNKTADYKEAQAYYCRAVDAVNDFYRTVSADSATKNAFLYTGTFIAMKAVRGFECVIARYKDDFRNDAANKGIEFIIPGTEQDTMESYSGFVRSIRGLSPDMDLWLRKFTNGQTYADKKHEDDRDLYDVPVTEDGLKIYHLETIIRYSEEMIKAINLLTSEHSSEHFDAEGANGYFESAYRKLTKLQRTYEDICNGNPDEIEPKDLISFCDRCVRVFKDCLSVLMIMNNQNPDNMDITELLTEITKNPKRKSEILVEDFKDNIMTLYSIADSGNANNLPATHKIVGWIGRTMEIANAIKKDFSGTVM